MVHWLASVASSPPQFQSVDCHENLPKAPSTARYSTGMLCVLLSWVGPLLPSSGGDAVPTHSPLFS